MNVSSALKNHSLQNKALIDMATGTQQSSQTSLVYNFTYLKSRQQLPFLLLHQDPIQPFVLPQSDFCPQKQLLSVLLIILEGKN